MCCFFPRVETVSGTSLFARSGRDGRQFLAYSMTKSSLEDVAMILPLPTPPNSPEDALTFISFKDYPDFFESLHACFPPTLAAASGTKSEPAREALKVVEVGDFEASFVPSAKDFGRLDERFRVPPTTWDELPVKGYGFAVFKLRKGVQKVHPMAFDFPRSDPSKLFFPTIHIHDGKVHPTADFDHTLYCQTSENERLRLLDWRESPRPAGVFVQVNKARGLVDGARHVYRRVLSGRRKNEDVTV